MVLNGPESICLFCGYEDDPENLANNYIISIKGESRYQAYKNGGDYPLERCPDSEQETLVTIENRFVCFSCLMEWDIKELDRCDYCNRLYKPPEGDIGMCNDCRDERAEKFMER